MRKANNTRRRATDRRGFTAAELAAVAAIIAILSLIIVPIFRDRVDEAKRAATLDDLQGLAKSELLAKADTGRYARLNDLDNPANLFNDPPTIAQEVPIGTTLGRFDAFARSQFALNWEGPYTAFQNSVTLVAMSPLLKKDLVTGVGNGPIIVFDLGGASPAGGPYADFNDDRYPIDHYGVPYIFRPPFADLPPGGYTSLGFTNETPFGNAFLYSLGPNGLPGDGTNGNFGSNDMRQNPFFEEAVQAGNDGIGRAGTDDLKYIF